MTLSYVQQISKMDKAQLKAHIEELEQKVEIYSERDWLMTEAYIQQIKICDARYLEMLCPEDIVEEGA